MTIFSKPLGGRGPFRPPGYAYEWDRGWWHKYTKQASSSSPV